MSERLAFRDLDAHVGERLDRVLMGKLEDHSRSYIQRMVEAGDVRVDGRMVQKNYKLRPGDTVEVTLPPPTVTDILPIDIPIEIVYEDDHLLVINKPRGLVVHPAIGHWDDTLVNALMYHRGTALSGIGGELRPGIVHRIDKDTSGLLVVAKNDLAHIGLSEQLGSHRMLREYEAVVYGGFGNDRGLIDAPLARHPNDRKRIAVVTDPGRPAKQAVTHYEVIARYRDFTHLRLRLETGRTHQIRVHMASVGHPVAGDPVYGPEKDKTGLGGQCLHARTLGFIHPVTGEQMRFDSPLPDYFTAFLRGLQPGSS